MDEMTKTQKRVAAIRNALGPAKMLIDEVQLRGDPEMWQLAREGMARTLEDLVGLLDDERDTRSKFDLPPGSTITVDIERHTRLQQSRRAWIDAATAHLDPEWNGTPDDLRAALAVNEVSAEHGDMLRVARLLDRDLSRAVTDLRGARLTVRECVRELRSIVTAYGPTSEYAQAAGYAHPSGTTVGGSGDRSDKKAPW